MSYSVTKIGGFGRPQLYREFLIDTIDDISSLPITGISSGSMAYCVEENSRYIFTNNKEWEILSGGGGGSDSGLPDVTSADNGKVLTVVDGGWAAASAGGGGALVVDFTYNASNATYTSTSLASDVITAFFAGTPVMCHFPSDDEGAPSDVVKTVTWITRPGEGASGITTIGFDASEEYITYSAIVDDHIVCSLYIPD